MKRYTFGDHLPLTGASAQLLTAAVGVGYPTTLTSLAKRAGISKFAASRAAGPLTQAGLIRCDEDGYSFNDSHPLARTIIELSWRFSGVRRASTQEQPQYLSWPRDDFHYRRVMPASLHHTEHPTPPLDSPAGPDLVTARDTCTWLIQHHNQLLEFEADGQAVYALWSNERLRDLIHQTLHLGGALDLALETLSAACGSDAQGESDPALVRVPAHAWVRATYLVSAEARDLLRVLDILDQAVWVGGTVNQLRSKIVSNVHAMNHIGRDSQGFDRQLTEALASEERSVALWDDPSYGRWHHVGGTPRPEDVGTAGDQIMAVRLRRAAQAVAAQVAAMSDHDCLAGWAANHPQEAAALPLVDHIPDEVLRGRLDRRASPTVGGGSEPPRS